MDPVLIGRKQLRAPLRSRGGGAAPLALVGLLVLVAGVGELQSHDRPGAQAAALRPITAVSYLSGTDLPKPLASMGFHVSAPRHGAYTFRLGNGSPKLTLAQSQQLFAYFLEAMARRG